MKSQKLGETGGIRSQGELPRSKRKKDTDNWRRKWGWGKYKNSNNALLKEVLKERGLSFFLKVFLHLLDSYFSSYIIWRKSCYFLSCYKEWGWGKRKSFLPFTYTPWDFWMFHFYDNFLNTFFLKKKNFFFFRFRVAS